MIVDKILINKALLLVSEKVRWSQILPLKKFCVESGVVHDKLFYVLPSRTTSDVG